MAFPITSYGNDAHRDDEGFIDFIINRFEPVCK